jgi:hypothetical protein
MFQASVQLVFAQKDCKDDVRRIIYYSLGLATGRFVLVEFPKHLLHGFYPILRRLQTFQHSDLAFTRYYAPRSPSEENVGLLPPSYALLDTALLDFNVISGNAGGASVEKRPLQGLVSRKDEFFRLVKEHTILDDGQATAFVEAMSSEVALVQGPPGTGKTFLGVSLTKAILAARSSTQRPILAVCMTNHALDSFLSDLLEHGVKKIARLGGGSKQEWTKQYTLKSLTSSVKATEREVQQRAQAYRKAKCRVFANA